MGGPSSSILEAGNSVRHSIGDFVKTYLGAPANIVLDFQASWLQVAQYDCGLDGFVQDYGWSGMSKIAALHNEFTGIGKDRPACWDSKMRQSAKVISVSPCNHAVCPRMPQKLQLTN